MRRKREKSAGAKAKASPEIKQEKIKRTRSKRWKQSTSSGNDSNDEIIAGVVSEEVIDPEQSVEQSSKTEGSTEELQDQVWQVKTPKGSGDGGEIQKLKICLTRPSSTPENAERSPRSKRKSTRTTSSSDSTSVEILDDKKKGKHRMKRSICDISDNSEKNNESHNNDQESDLQTVNSVVSTVAEVETAVDIIKTPDQSLQSKSNEEAEVDVGSNDKTASDERLPISVDTKLHENSESTEVKTDLEKEKSNSDNESCEAKAVLKEEESKSNNEKGELSLEVERNQNETQSESTENISIEKKIVDDTEREVVSSELIITSSAVEEMTVDNESSQQENQNEHFQKKHDSVESLRITNSERKRSLSVDKSEILEIHAEDSKIDISYSGPKETQNEDENDGDKNGCAAITEEDQVSNIQETALRSLPENPEPPQNEIEISTNQTDVVAKSEDAVNENSEQSCYSSFVDQKKVSTLIEDQPECTQEIKKDFGQNGSPNIIINRKRRWGSRPNKLSSQKSITISTDVLKEIIPDVKPVEFAEIIEEKKQHKRVEVTKTEERPVLPKLIKDFTDIVVQKGDEKEHGLDDFQVKERTNLASKRKISIVEDSDKLAVIRPPSPPKHKQSNILYITNLVRPFTLSQLKNLLQRTGKIVENGFWINKIKSKCFVIYEDEEQAVETRHALHGVTWPVSNPKTLHVDFSTQEEFEQTKLKEESEGAQVSNIPGTVEDWLREQDLKREREVEKPWERKKTREWDVGKNEKDVKLDQEKEKSRGDRPIEKRRHYSPERSPEPARKFKKKEEAPAKLLDDLFRKTKTTPCIYWLPLSAETIAVKEEQRRQHMAEYERRMMEFRRTQRRH